MHWKKKTFFFLYILYYKKKQDKTKKSSSFSKQVTEGKFRYFIWTEFDVIFNFSENFSQKLMNINCTAKISTSYGNRGGGINWGKNDSVINHNLVQSNSKFFPSALFYYICSLTQHIQCTILHFHPKLSSILFALLQ